MPNGRLIAIVTVLMSLGAGAHGQSTVGLEQLREIERLIVARNCGGLRAFLAVNPALIEGGDPLAIELREFVSGVDTGLIDCLSLSNDDGDAGVTRTVDLGADSY
ncbi:MAG: hypothetical protein AAF871_00955 [Pseudomonadota bacterium]